MKHYSELTNLEDQIIQLGVLKSLVRGLNPGITEGTQEDTENIIWHLSDQIESIHDCLRANFNDLFAAIREESQNETKARKPKAKKQV